MFHSNIFLFFSKSKHSVTSYLKVATFTFFEKLGVKVWVQSAENMDQIRVWE